MPMLPDDAHPKLDCDYGCPIVGRGGGGALVVATQTAQYI